MSDFSLWSCDAKEMVRAFTSEDLSSQSTESFITGLGFYDYAESFSPMSTERLMLVYSGSEYVFRPHELYWLKYADFVVSGTCEDFDINIYTLEMSCDVKDYYITCGAIIKLFNIAFKETNMFIFKFPDAIAFGAGRWFEMRGGDADFCVSGLISASDPDADYSLFEELAWGDFSSAIARHSPQERIDSLPKYDYAEGSLLSHSLTSFDVGIGEEGKNQLHFQYAGENQYQRIFSYKDTKKLLSNVGVRDDATSFDVLEIAEEAEQRAALYRTLQEQSAGSEAHDIEREKTEGQQDADALLNDILDNYSRF